MAKIILNNKEFNIDDAVIASINEGLKNHLLATMAGEGATITLDGTIYNVDSTKLATAKNDFVAHLGTIAGEGTKVMVNGVEYAVDATKIAGAMSELENAFSELANGNNSEHTPNEYGFYYDAPYTFSQESDGVVVSYHLVLKEDGSVEQYVSQGEVRGVPGASYYGENVSMFYTYHDGVLDYNSNEGFSGTLNVSSDGLSLIDTNGSMTDIAGAAFVCTFEEYHDVYFETLYYDQGMGYDATFYADGSAVFSDGESAPAGSFSCTSHKIIAGGNSYLYVSMDGKTIWSKEAPLLAMMPQ